MVQFLVRFRDQNAMRNWQLDLYGIQIIYRYLTPFPETFYGNQYKNATMLKSTDIFIYNKNNLKIV